MKNSVVIFGGLHFLWVRFLYCLRLTQRPISSCSCEEANDVNPCKLIVVAALWRPSGSPSATVAPADLWQLSGSPMMAFVNALALPSRGPPAALTQPS